ncbi:MAG: hypothetical protein ACR2RL_06595 [Gammaproteobacteria bacterium]
MQPLRIVAYTGQGLMVVGVVTAFLLAVTALCLDMWATGIWLAGVAWCAAAAAIRWRLVFRSMLALLLIAAALGWAVPPLELGRFMDAATQDITQRGAMALSVRHRAGYYLLNVAMGLAGHAAGLHEAAFMTWGLTVPGPRERHRDGAFLLRDPAVRSALSRMRASDKTTLAWQDYFHPAVSPSVALAANCPLHLEVIEHDVDRGTKHVRGSCEVAYPRLSRLYLGTVGRQTVYVQEGGFWVLQEARWLHPYVVHWDLEVTVEVLVAPVAGRPRLRLRERLLVWMLGP